MNLPGLFLLALGLSMDAFAVAVCAGLSMQKVTIKGALIVGLWFGAFQAGMPVIGYFIGNAFAGVVDAFSSIIAFVLLSFIGGKMIWGSLHKKKSVGLGLGDDFSLKPANMLTFAFATSIDAMAVGISFAFLSVSIFHAAALIGVTTLVMSMAGVALGGLVGAKFNTWAQLAGGLLLILMGIRILIA